MRRLGLKFSAALLAVLSLVEFGQAGWIHAKALVAQELLLSAWERTVDGEQQVRPWPWADTSIVGLLEVPGQRIKQVVLEGDSGRVLAFGPGKSAYSSPAARITILGGHRDTHFEFLQFVVPGDLIRLSVAEGATEYRVRSISVSDQPQLTIANDRSVQTLLLVTCYPFDALQPGGHQRFVVYAEEVNRLTPGGLPDYI